MLVENELAKLQKFDAAYFRGKSHFEEDSTQNYLVFQPICRYFRIIGVGCGNYIYFWKSIGLSGERLKITPELSYYGTKIRVEFDGSCLNQDKITYNHGKTVNIYIYEEFSFDNGFGRNYIIFGADLSSSSHANNKKNSILVFGKDFVQGVNGTTIYAEKLCSINFTASNK